jgi:hypothetical protein
MNSQDLHNLQEAYLDVYELDELYKRTLQSYQSKAKNQVLGSMSKVSDTTVKRVKGLQLAQKRLKDKKYGQQKEQLDLYDIILSHLLDEGYAETQEQAEVIMVNMSEDWRESICEAMVDSGLKGQEKKKIRNERNFGTNTLSKSKSTKERHKKHREIRGMKKIKGDKTGEKESSILSQSSRVHKSYNNGYNRDGSYMG